MSTESRQETDVRCPLCGEPLPANATECTKCDWVPGYREEAAKRVQRDPRDVAAALLSLFLPGAGHFFKGYQILGVAILVVGLPIIVTFAFAFTMFFGWLLVPCYWVGVAADAYFRRNLRPVPAPKRSA